MSGLVEVNVSQLLNDRSYFAGNDQLKDAGHVCIRGCREKWKVQGIVVRLGYTIWSTFFTEISDHVMSYLCSLHLDYSVIDLALHLPYTAWWQMRSEKVESLGVEEILV